MRIALGMVYLGLAVSSPSTAAASKPMNDVKLNTVAKNNPDNPVGREVGENGASERPESPPLARIMKARTRTDSTASAAKSSCMLGAMRIAKNATRTRMTSSEQKSTNQ